MWKMKVTKKITKQMLDRKLKTKTREMQIVALMKKWSPKVKKNQNKKLSKSK